MSRNGLLLIGYLLAACAPRENVSASSDPRLTKAEAFVDAFYSFDQARLRQALSDAPASLPNILYYQGWAEGGGYKVLDRQPCQFDKPNQVSCGITVRDDLVPALGFDWHVTDVFHFAFDGGSIVKVWNSSNDPPEFEQAMKWLRQERPEIFSGPCRDMFNGGPTPGECERAIVKGFANFTATKRRQSP